MAHAHAHGPSAPPRPASRRVRLLLGAVIGMTMVVTAVALVVLWPHEEVATPRTGAPTAIDYLDATVVAVESTTCGPMACEAVQARLDSGPLAGSVVELAKLTSSTPEPLVQVGDRIVVAQEISLTVDAPTYAFADHQRRAPLWGLTLLFALVVVGVARWRGVAALVGLFFTWWVLITFLLPAILAGSPPIAVALTASSLILLVVLYLAHGFNARTSTALIGTMVSLGLTGLLGWWFVDAAHLTGLTSDEATYLATSVGTVDLSGLLLCGIIIGSLGVLNDVTVTQAASVWEIHAADPRQPVRRLYRSGMRIGRDHIASTVYTLVLAYAGASLPLVILFVIGNRRFGDVVNGEILAEELIRTLVGSIGLVASVPLTTFLAAVVVVNQGVADPATVTPPAPLHRRVLAGVAAVAPGRASLTVDGDDAGRVPTSPPASSPTPPPSPRRDRRADRERRRAERDARVREKEAAWEPPAAEREFWDD